MFNFTEVTDAPKLSFVGYGINEPVIVSNVEAGASEKGTPNLAIKLKFATEKDDSNSTTIRLWFSEKAKAIGMRKIMHIHKALGKEETLKNLQAETLDQLAAALKVMWANKPMRIKLTGEEYMGVDKEGKQKVKVRLNVPFPPFAEALTEGAEKPKVETTSLTFDKSNSYDYKPLDATQIPVEKPEVIGGEDDIMF
jgi:hypothetical protein